MLARLVTGLGLVFISTAAPAASFSEVWTQLKSDPYDALPKYQTTYGSFFQGKTLFSCGQNLLRAAANRTVKSTADLLPPFQKLVHPLGICFSGTWTIDEASPYTGYFAQGSRGLIIVRASEATGQTLASGRRSLGFAGKVFPTTDPLADRATANFFSMDDLGGVKADAFLDQTFTNAPPLSKHLGMLTNIPALLTIATAFNQADSNPAVRQVYPIAELGMENPTAAVTPYLISIRAENAERPGSLDFRNELRLTYYPGGLRFSISVAEKGQTPRRIGTIHLTEEALSASGDHRLHFFHAPWRG